MLPQSCDKCHFLSLPLGAHQASVCPALRFALLHCISNHFHHFLSMLRSSPIQVILPQATETPDPPSLIFPYHNTCKLPLTGYRSVFPLPITITSLLFCPVLSISVSLLSLSRSQVQVSSKLLHAIKTLHITNLINTLKTYANCCQRFLKEKWSVYIE